MRPGTYRSRVYPYAVELGREATWQAWAEISYFIVMDVAGPVEPKYVGLGIPEDVEVCDEALAKNDYVDVPVSEATTIGGYQADVLDFVATCLIKHPNGEFADSPSSQVSGFASTNQPWRRPGHHPRRACECRGNRRLLRQGDSDRRLHRVPRGMNRRNRLAITVGSRFRSPGG